MPVLLDELDKLDRAGYQATSRLLVDDQATILSESHHHFEEDSRMHERLGSTGKGIGAARADRILRKAELYGGGLDTSKIIKQSLAQGATVLIEGTQGYGLGLHAGNYPYCTSSDCRAIDFCAMAGVNPWDPEVGQFDIYVTLRTYPIRVAGNSGPMKGETSWEELGFEPERTTVTQKIRRVGSWDPDLARAAVAANGGAPTVKVALTMFDYVFPETKNKTDFEWTPQIQEYVQQVQREVNAGVYLLGTGPSTMLEI
jgi:adenylosuccinate synthase